MSTSVSPNSSNVYAIMNQPGASMNNVDSQRALSIGSELQQGIQETQQESSKGATDNFKQTLYKINVLV